LELASHPLVKWAKLLGAYALTLALELCLSGLGWGSLVLLLFITCPSPESLHDFLDDRMRALAAKANGSLAKLLRSFDPTKSLASVQSYDLKLLVIADVRFFTERLYVVGLLGEWYVLNRAAASVWESNGISEALQSAKDGAQELQGDARGLLERLRALLRGDGSMA
jgi:hypothetical protein